MEWVVGHGAVWLGWPVEFFPITSLPCGDCSSSQGFCFHSDCFCRDVAFFPLPTRFWSLSPPPSSQDISAFKWTMRKFSFFPLFFSFLSPSSLSSFFTFFSLSHTQCFTHRQTAQVWVPSSCWNTRAPHLWPAAWSWMLEKHSDSDFLQFPEYLRDFYHIHRLICLYNDDSRQCWDLSFVEGYFKNVCLLSRRRQWCKNSVFLFLIKGRWWVFLLRVDGWCSY